MIVAREKKRRGKWRKARQFENLKQRGAKDSVLSVDIVGTTISCIAFDPFSIAAFLLFLFSLYFSMFFIQINNENQLEPYNHFHLFIQLYLFNCF